MASIPQEASASAGKNHLLHSSTQGTRFGGRGRARREENSKVIKRWLGVLDPAIFAKMLSSPGPGQKVPPDVKVLRAFYEIGKQFEQGSESLSKIHAVFERRSFEASLPVGVPSARSSLTRTCKAVRKYFAARIGVQQEVPLFADRGDGLAITGLTELGRVAWQWTRQRLIALDVIAESD